MPESPESQESHDPNAPKLVERAAAEVRREPVKSVATAFVVGLVLSIFPIGRILAAVLALVGALIRPMLMIFGALKVWEEVEKRKR